MLSPEEKRLFAKLVAATESLAKTMMTINENIVLVARDLVPARTAMETETDFKEGDVFEVTERFSPLFKQRGKVMEILGPCSLLVEMFRSRRTLTLSPRQLELVASNPDEIKPGSKFGVYDQGRMKPYEWRHNLGMKTFVDPDDESENMQMTEEAFRIYNAGLQG